MWYFITSPADARIPYSIGDTEFVNSFKLKPLPVYSLHKVLYVKCNISFLNYLASIWKTHLKVWIKPWYGDVKARNSCFFQACDWSIVTDVYFLLVETAGPTSHLTSFHMATYVRTSVLSVQKGIIKINSLCRKE